MGKNIHIYKKDLCCYTLALTDEEGRYLFLNSTLKNKVKLYLRV